jgi:hypothetical protein
MDVAADRALARPEAHRSSRLWPRGSVLLLAPLLPAGIFMPALIGRVLLAPDDGYFYYLPLHKLAAAAWSAGHLPAWNPFQLSGAPLLASQAGAFSPLNLIFLLLPTVQANNVYVVVNLAIGALGASLLARRLVRDNAAAVVAGFAFVSSGFMYGHIAHQGVIGGAVWMPWVLLGYDLLAERRSLPRFLLAAGSLALSAVSGHPQMFFVIVLVLAIYAAATPAFADTGKRERLSSFLLTISAAAGIALLLPASSWALVVFVVFFLGICARSAVMAAQRARASRTGGDSRRWVWLVPGVVLLGVALAAVQLFPTAAIAGETVRSWPDLGTATSYSFSASHLILLLFPYLFGNSYSVAPFTTVYDGHWNLTELAGYPGLAAIVLAAAGLPRIRHDARALALGAAALVALLIALGRSIGLGLLVALLPVYGQFRAWGRYSVVIDLAIAIFAAYGVAHLRSTHARERQRAVKRSWIVAGALVAIGVLIPLVPAVGQFAVSGREHLLAVGIPIAAATLAASTVLLFGRFERLALVLCCFLVAADGALSFGLFFEWRQSPSPAQIRALYATDQPPPWGSVPRTSGGINRYLFAGRWSPVMVPYFPQVTDLKGMRSANGYEPLLPGRYSDVVGGMVDAGGINRGEQFLEERSWLLDVLRISAVLVPTEDAPTSMPHWFDSSLTVGRLVRYRYTPRVPAAFVVGKVNTVNTRTASAVGRGEIPFDPRRAAVVEGDCRSCALMRTPGFAGTVTRSEWGSGTVEADVVATRAGLLVMSESWFPGWSATVDGKTAPVLRADAVVVGVPVPAGRHHVEIRYRPPGFVAGATLSSLTLGAFLLAPLLMYARRRKRQRSATQRSKAPA